MRNLVKLAMVFAVFIGCFVFGQTTNENFAKFVEKRYSAKVEFINKSDFDVIYRDGKRLSARLQSDGSYQIKDSEFKEYILDVAQINQEIDDASPVSSFTFRAAVNPCNKHPKGEKFNTCFKREWDAFCDGFAGCVAQATNPHWVALVITAHCLAC